VGKCQIGKKMLKKNKCQIENHQPGTNAHRRTTVELGLFCPAFANAMLYTGF
jgi:hypothetical protein